jgi:hypothetical protein
MVGRPPALADDGAPGAIISDSSHLQSNFRVTTE